ncbi:hypothetical protein SYNPS1DRAFT_30670, partial [Syncephalis pseudoplumigaleata]
PLSDPTLAYCPVGGLYALAHLRGPAGVEFYLQFNPLVAIRAPDCLGLGLVDRFVPERLLGDWLRQVRSALPPGMDMGTTAAAQRLREAALMGDKQWPGCSIVDCWKSEIELCFADMHSIEQMLDRLEQLDKPWAQATAGYVRSLPPLLAKIMYRALRMGKQLDREQCSELEVLVASNWSRSSDARQLQSYQMTGKEASWEYPTLASVTDDVLDGYFAAPSDADAMQERAASPLANESRRQDVDTCSIHCYKSPWRAIDANIDYAALDAMRPKCPYFHG